MTRSPGKNCCKSIILSGYTRIDMVFIERGIKIKVRVHIKARMSVSRRLFCCNDNAPIILYIRDYAVKRAIVTDKWTYRC